MELKHVETADLINELTTRTGVEKIIVEPSRPYEFRKPYEGQKTIMTSGFILVVSNSVES